MRFYRFPVMGVIVASLGLAGGAVAQSAAGVSSTVTLAQMRDEVRPLLIFAPVADDARLVEQVRAVSAHSAEAAERNLVTVAVPGRGSYAAGHRLSEQDGAAARRKFGVAADDFVVILVGKDGGEKLRSDKPFTFEKLRDVIDSMPMRREEMKGKKE